MKSSSILCMTTALAAVLSLAAVAVRADERAPAALSGQVTSDAEGAMEGVVVTARKDGSIVSSSVTTDAKGHYAFPENRLEPGHYTVAIRAIGYDLPALASANVAAERTSSLDLKLEKTHDLASQLSNAEWMMSIPGSEEQKAMLLDCVGCHTLERIVRSNHDVNEWMQTISRMKGYGAVSQPIKPQPMLDPDRAGKPEDYRKMAEYLATINLSATDHWQYSLKTLPRPTGRSTHVIVTEYDVVRPTTEPHDVVLDRDGNVWYSDFGELFISKFDPLAAEWNDNRVQLNFVGLRHDVDGKVWTKSVGTQDIFRLDIASNTWEKFHPTSELPAGHNYSMYQVISDSKNNLWMAEFSEGYLGTIDAKTHAVKWFAVPTPNARARRMEIDDQDRIVVTEYRGNKVAVFYTRTEKFTEYPLPPYTFPYRANIDRNGDIWASTMATDRVVRMNPTTPVSFWVGSNHAHALVKVEPLD